MSAPQFTPGQWTYGVRDDGSIWQSRGDPLEGAHYQDDFYGTEGDARLIAAAPDMYRVLANAVAQYDAIKGGPILGALEAARAILAKARGEQA